MKKILAISSILISMAISGTYAYAIDPDEEDVYFILSGEADKAIAEGDYQTAILRIKEALSIDPSNPSNVLLLSNLGNLYDRLDQDSLALETYNHAHAIAPAMTTVLDNRARLYLKMGRSDEAYNDFSTVLERDSLNLEARYYHGMIALMDGSIDALKTADTDFKLLRELAPDKTPTLVASALYYDFTYNHKEAIPYYQKLIEETPSPEYYGNLAKCYLGMGELSQASEIISQGLKEYPEDGELYFCRAWLNKDSFLIKEARKDAETARKLGVAPERIDQLLK